MVNHPQRQARETGLSQHLILTSEAMARFRIRDRTNFIKLARREGIPHYRITSRRFLWDERDIDAFLGRRRVGRSTKAL